MNQILDLLRQYWPLLLPLGALLFSLVALSSIKKRGQGAGGEDDQTSGWSVDDDESWEQLKPNTSDTDKQQSVSRILEVGDESSGLLRESTGYGSISDYDASRDQNTVQDIARQVSWDFLQMLEVAQHQKDIVFDLKGRSVRVESSSPSRIMDIERMRGVDDVLTGPIENWALLSRQEFALAIAEESILVPRYYDVENQVHILYVLLDVSPSMQEKMYNGLSRSIWARGVLLSLLFKAVKGGAKYWLRFFDAGVSDLMKIETPQQAKSLIDTILNRQANGNGTEIYSALKTAVKDLQEDTRKLTVDILLVSDGQDTLDYSTLRHLFGEFRLHVVQLGESSNAILAKAATSYKHFQ
jgi:uncharacterized protein with von Willebrand factor type A (vWA) domain